MSPAITRPIFGPCYPSVFYVLKKQKAGTICTRFSFFDDAWTRLIIVASLVVERDVETFGFFVL